jgi:hypothetical protein
MEQPLIESAERQTFQRHPIPGWALDPLTRCDEACPGLLRRTLVGSSLRRQTIFMGLRHLTTNNPKDLATKLRPLVCGDSTDLTCPLAIIGQALMTVRVRDLLRALYGPIEGLIGTLGRLGFDPLAPEDYCTLIEIHTGSRHRSRARILRYMRSVTRQDIRALLALRPPYLLPVLVRRLSSAQQVEDFQCSIDLIKRLIPEATDADLVASLKNLRPSTHIREWVTRWLHRATVFVNDPPIKDDGEFVLLNSASAIRDAARRFSNCLERDRLVHCALGREGYVEHLPSQTLVELRLLNRGAVLEEFHGIRNSSVGTETARAIIKGLQDRGVLIPAQLAQASANNRVARFARIFDLTRNDYDLIDPSNRIQLRASHAP